jgi:hypothetical protein
MRYGIILFLLSLEIIKSIFFLTNIFNNILVFVVSAGIFLVVYLKCPEEREISLPNF